MALPNLLSSLSIGPVRLRNRIVSSSHQTTLVDRHLPTDEFVAYQAARAAGETGLASRGQAAQCRLDEQQLAALDVALEAGPLAAGWEDQRWTLARVRDLVAGKFKEQYTVPGIWYLLQRRGWTCQIGARRAIERDDGAVEVWKKETWPRIKGPRRPSAAGSSSKTSAASR